MGEVYTTWNEIIGLVILYSAVFLLVGAAIAWVVASYLHDRRDSAVPADQPLVGDISEISVVLRDPLNDVIMERREFTNAYDMVSYMLVNKDYDQSITVKRQNGSYVRAETVTSS
jgi:hypothetical protein